MKKIYIFIVSLMSIGCESNYKSCNDNSNVVGELFDLNQYINRYDTLESKYFDCVSRTYLEYDSIIANLRIKVLTRSGGVKPGNNEGFSKLVQPCKKGQNLEFFNAELKSGLKELFNSCEGDGKKELTLLKNVLNLYFFGDNPKFSDNYIKEATNEELVNDILILQLWGAIKIGIYQDNIRKRHLAKIIEESSRQE